MAKSLSNGGTNHCFWYLICISCNFWLILLYCQNHNIVNPWLGTLSQHLTADSCSGRYIFIYQLSPRFNSDILADCCNNSVCKYSCRAGFNAGLGEPISNMTETGGWFATEHNALDVIFHARMERYECLTANATRASAFYVPFYAGIDFARHQWGYNASVRDETVIEVLKWLTSRPEWAAMGGKDHFMVAGRPTWDFRRLDDQACWGNSLLLQPQTSNMSVLTVESAPWDSNDPSVPYPTYFHPSSDAELIAWQESVRSFSRPWLFSFVGGPRPGQNDSIRGQIIEQCRASSQCNLLDFAKSPNDWSKPKLIMRVFQSAVFCLQPRGDSATRRSVFDSMVAGCVPVFFHPDTAYLQYKWHLPEKKESYSVFLEEEAVREGKVSIGEVLSGYSEERVREMREEVVKMMPRLVYAHPRAEEKRFKDAFDVAVEGVLRRVKRARKKMLVEVSQEA